MWCFEPNRLEELSQNGFAIIPDAIDEVTVSALIHAIEQVEENVSTRRRKHTTYAIRNLLATVPAVAALAASTPIRSIVEKILGPRAFVARGLLFDKTPSANWKVAWHQDLTIETRRRMEIPGYGPWSVKAGVHHVQPPADVLEKMLALRLHLDDCNEFNGPLQVIPGSHRSGKLNANEIRDWRARAVTVRCMVGSGGILLMRPLLLHASSPAQRPGHRRVIHLEFANEKLNLMRTYPGVTTA